MRMSSSKCTALPLWSRTLLVLDRNTCPTPLSILEWNSFFLITNTGIEDAEAIRGWRFNMLQFKGTEGLGGCCHWKGKCKGKSKKAILESAEKPFWTQEYPQGFSPWALPGSCWSGVQYNRAANFLKRKTCPFNRGSMECYLSGYIIDLHTTKSFSCPMLRVKPLFSYGETARGNCCLPCQEDDVYWQNAGFPPGPFQVKKMELGRRKKSWIPHPSLGWTSL